MIYDNNQTNDARLVQNRERGTHWLHRLVGASGLNRQQNQGFGECQNKCDLAIDYGNRLP